MPLRIGNYGQWEGDRRGNRPGNYHPPACTCFSCNEGRRRRQRPSKPADTGTQRASRPPGAENQRTSKPNNSDQQSSRSPKARPERQRRSSSPRQPRDGSGQGGGGCACLLIILVMIVGIGIVVGLAIWGPQEPIFSSVKPATSADAAPAPTPVLTLTPLPSPEPTATPFLAVERERAAGYLRGFTQAVTELKATIVPAVTEFVSDPTLAPSDAGTAPASESPDAPAPQPNSTPVPSPVDPLTDISTKAMALVNEKRASLGIPSLETSEELVQIATQHSGDMAAQGYFAHDSPNGSDYLDRYRQAGFRCQRRVGSIIHQGAENIYQGWASNSLTVRNWRLVTIQVANAQELAAEAVWEWLQSPGHRTNMMNYVYKQQGIRVMVAGVAVGAGDKVYITHNFC